MTPAIFFIVTVNLVLGIAAGAVMYRADFCVVGTLYKMGGGSVISATAFIGLIAGSGILQRSIRGGAVLSSGSPFSRDTLPSRR